MRFLGIDVGEKRIGLALSDELGRLASPLATIQRVSDRGAVGEILSAVREHGIADIVVGVPYMMDGSVGPQALKVLDFVEKLRGELALPLHLWDESLSTRRAEEAPSIRKRSRAEKGVKDRVAAAFILQDFLDSAEKGRSAG